MPPAPALLPLTADISSSDTDFDTVTELPSNGETKTPPNAAGREHCEASPRRSRSPCPHSSVSRAAVFIALAFSVLSMYALAAARFRALLASRTARRTFNRTGALCLFGAGAYVATLRHGG